jgi:DNA-binding MarR family transcriptional regulator
VPFPLDPVIHAPLRLQICVMLAAIGSLDFAGMRASLDVSESVLSKHVKVLEAAGYVAVRKVVSDARQRTWLALTPAGQAAFAVHATALRSLLGPAT